MLESGVFVRDHGTRLEELQMKDSGIMLKFSKLYLVHPLT